MHILPTRPIELLKPITPAPHNGNTGIVPPYLSEKIRPAYGPGTGIVPPWIVTPQPIAGIAALAR